MIDQIRKAIEGLVERLQDFADGLDEISPDRNRLAGEPVPVYVDRPYPVTKRRPANN